MHNIEVAPHNFLASLGKKSAGQRCGRQTHVSSDEAVGCLESADFSPNSALGGP